jgi:plastocyanin
VAGVWAFAASSSLANTAEIDWDSNSGFSPGFISINAGDEVDFVNYDDTFDLQITGSPPPENFSADIPPTDGFYVYYVPIVYNSPGTYHASDEFGETVTITVNSILPLSVAITNPTNNTAFSAPATFSMTAVPAGGAAPYLDVQFFIGTNDAGNLSASPFSTGVTNLPVGTYLISAFVTDSDLNMASNSIVVTVGPPLGTNFIVPAACGNIYSSGNVTGGYLSAGSNPRGALEFAGFNAGYYSSILLELNPYGLPLFGPTISVYGFDGANGTLYGSNYNSGTLVGLWTLPPGLGYGQVATFDVTAFVKSTKGPYFGFLLVAGGGGDLFSSTTINYGTPPELFAIALLLPQLTAARAGNQAIVSWPTNYAAGFSLESATNLQSGGWNAVTNPPALVGTNWVMTNSQSGPGQFFRLSSQ